MVLVVVVMDLSVGCAVRETAANRLVQETASSRQADAPGYR